MVKLRQLGVTEYLWTLIDDCHTNKFCSVAVNQINSGWFPVFQGVRQGGFFLPFSIQCILMLFYRISKTCPNVGIFSVKSSNSTLADDIACIALSLQGVQTLLNTLLNILPMQNQIQRKKKIQCSPSQDFRTTCQFHVMATQKRNSSALQNL